jgi:hypothetical protein
VRKGALGLTAGENMYYRVQLAVNLDEVITCLLKPVQVSTIPEQQKNA